jgi:NAD(P)-dependent dehydrogenase (short-subunit alcohol dehydrogenase family)
MSDLPHIKTADDKVLAGRRALVTGASKGIGRAAAIRMARAGADVVVNYCSDEGGAEAAAKEIRGLGCRALVIQADVASHEQVLAMFERVQKEWGALDILVNNAGISPIKPFLEMTAEEWQRVIGTNLTGAALCAQAALRGMVAQRRGKIIVVSSIHSIRTNAGRAPYAASKGGLDALTRALAVEFGPLGICVNSLVVGAAASERTDRIASDYGAAKWAEWKKCIPVGRWGTLEEIAEAVLYLAGPAADWINGASLCIDGGQSSILYHP